jgi:hypothetical protein
VLIRPVRDQLPCLLGVGARVNEQKDGSWHGCEIHVWIIGMQNQFNFIEKMQRKKFQLLEVYGVGASEETGRTSLLDRLLVVDLRSERQLAPLLDVACYSLHSKL